MSMKWIVGLGNPGPKYQLTRHNIGFIVIDAIAQEFGGSFKDEHKASVAKVTIDGEKVLLIKPQTFMNLSGEALRALMDYYQLELKDLLVIHDEVDLPFGQMKMHKKKSAGGHNGIKSTHQHLGTDDYARLRLGVGRPSHPSQEVADFVLQNFSKDEMKTIGDFLGDAVDATLSFMKDGFERAANQFNTKKEVK